MADKTYTDDSLRKRSQLRDTWRRLRRNKLAMVGLVLVLILVLAAVFADFVAPYDPAQQDLMNMRAFPSKAHLLGTDEYGREAMWLDGSYTPVQQEDGSWELEMSDPYLYGYDLPEHWGL